MFADFKPLQEGTKKVLGELEADILDLIWADEPVTVRDVCDKLLITRKTEKKHKTNKLNMQANKASVLRR